MAKIKSTYIGDTTMQLVGDVVATMGLAHPLLPANNVISKLGVVPFETALDVLVVFLSPLGPY
jgi:hypothetical protein